MQEINAIKFAKKNKIFVASVIDHWINYEKRFIRKKKFFYLMKYGHHKYAYKLQKKI